MKSRRGSRASPHRVRSRSPVDREEGEFSPLVSKKRSSRNKRRAAELELLRQEEEMEFEREKAERLEKEKEESERRLAQENARKEELRRRKAMEQERRAEDKSAEERDAHGYRKRDAVGLQGRDRVKNSLGDVYVVCENIMSAPKRITMEVQDRVVVVKNDSACVSESVSVLQDMQKVTYDLRRLLLNDANKVTKFMVDQILAQVSKYEIIISKVSLEKERLRGRAEANESIHEKLTKVGDNVDLVYKNVCRVNETCESLSARPVGAPSGAGQGSTPAGQPKSFAVIVRGANKDLSTAEVRQRLQESVCPEVDVCVRSIRLVRGGGVVIETASDRDRKRLTGSSTFHEVGLRAVEPKRIDPCIIIYDVPCALTDGELLSSLHGKTSLSVGRVWLGAGARRECG